MIFTRSVTSWFCYFAEREIECSLEDLLTFMTASDCVPLGGYAKAPTVIFLHHETAILPTASTCDLQLRLPAVHKKYEKFRDAMLLGILGNDGFGGV